jgi:hypothetical protein
MRFPRGGEPGEEAAYSGCPGQPFMVEALVTALDAEYKEVLAAHPG